ncbi:GPP34 family phosphoprotein [Brachybacterium sp. GCM10030252]|uniref:GOLPH3/VPS74 family protein n=1 Tax=Brachybacterium sp. GCM10030252 TaxID=3273380 RepID=UPI00361C6A8F
MTTTTIPGELFLLLTDDAGRQEATSSRKEAVAAAAVAELMLRERVQLSEEKQPRVQVTDTSSTGIPVIDQALGALTELAPGRLRSVISHRWMDLTEVTGEGLVAAGALRRKDGWFTTTWPAHDETLETGLRARLGAAVADPSKASLQDASLLELLRALGIAHRILKDDVAGMSRRDLDRAIQGLAVDHPAARAVKRAMDDMTAVMIATTAATTTVIT